jgi:hypothetical protein
MLFIAAISAIRFVVRLPAPVALVVHRPLVSWSLTTLEPMPTHMDPA